jgi:hypothetical protein
MATVAEILEDLNFVTDLLSNRVRTISVSILAIAWLFIAGGDSSPVLPTKPDRILLLVSGGFALLTLICDYLQYIFGYIGTNKVMGQAERSTAPKQADFDYKAFVWRARNALFWIKQGLMVVTLGLFGLAVFKALL